MEGYHKVLADESGELSFDEMQLGLQAFHLRPRIQISHEDFNIISQNGILTNEDGTMTKDMFREMMMFQMRDYIGRSMAKQAQLPQNQRSVSSIFAGLNWLMMMSLKEETHTAKNNHFTRTRSSEAACPASDRLVRSVAREPMTEQEAQGQEGRAAFKEGSAALNVLHSGPKLHLAVPPMYVSHALCIPARVRVFVHGGWLEECVCAH